MDQATHNKIVSFIWGIADDVLRDLFKRGGFTRHFCKPKLLRTLAEISADVLIEKVREGLSDGLPRGVAQP